MIFSLIKSLEVLQNTPGVIASLTNNLSEEWLTMNEGYGTWTVKEVVSHLIVCEQTNWLVRAKIILSNQNVKEFSPIDMTTHFEVAQNNSVESLVRQFKQLREDGLRDILSLDLQESDFLKTANHSLLGEVSLKQLVSTWVAHDLTHISQITRIIAKQYKDELGPFIEFMKRLD
jgi:uncharacterized damage-inducible protein DinB